MGQPTQRSYKRSWKNLLINKDYQLRMTMVLVGVSAILIAGLGWWVMDQAKTATEVAINNVEGTRCEKPSPLASATPSRIVVDEITELAPPKPAPDAPDSSGKLPDEAADDSKKEEAPPSDAPEPGAAVDKEPAAADPKPAAAGDESDEGVEGERERPQVTITDSDMDLQAAPNDNAVAGVSAAQHKAQEERYRECELAKRTKVEDLRQGETLILQVLIGLGLVMVLGLAAYGIKMTHKVAGPLFKITLYLRKLQNNTYDTVYNLRKGDHLVEFYDHFKSAHAGVREMQDEDIRRLKELLVIADKEDLASKSPELAAAIEELRKTLKDKEDSIA